MNKQYTWNAENLFKYKKQSEAAVEQNHANLTTITKFEGNIGESPETLVKAFNLVEDLTKRLLHVFIYAGFSYNVDTTDQSAAAMYGKAQGVYGQVAGTIAFINPELLSIGKPKLDKWMKQNPKLAIQAHNL